MIVMPLEPAPPPTSVSSRDCPVCGQPVHWSQVPEYVPAENYWELNNRPKVYATPKLELIASHERPDKRV